MTFNGWLQIVLFSVLVILLTRPFGGYMTRVFTGERTFLSLVLRPLERTIYWLCGVDENSEQHWVSYAIAMLAFSFVGFVVLYGLQRLQAVLPLNPQGQAAVGPDLAFNTSVSFVTNTNWQSYVPEQTMSYLTQMAGLAVHNFVSAATGIALAIALIRGFARRSAQGIGNFWVDLTRSVLYVLLPISLVVALFFVWQGMPQNFSAYTDATTLEGGKQLIAQGPVASQEVIKLLGTNGGGFFNANSAHPYENPTALTNFIEMLLIFSIGAGLTNVFGRMVDNQRQGWAIFAVMFLLFLAGTAIAYAVESHGNPAFAAFHVDQSAGELQAGGNMEGKEVRFGDTSTALFGVAATQTSTGSADASYDSFNPMGGFGLLSGMMLGEVTPGGTGTGLYTILIYAIVAVFIGGLMIGRTPEYLGKKIQAREVKLAGLGSLVMPLAVLVLTGIAVSVHAGRVGPLNAGPHGFTEILYALTSQANNNGSAFGGLSGNTAFYNVTGAIAMLVGRFGIMVPALALGGSLAAKGVVPASLGTFRTDNAMFIGLVVGVILIIGGLTFFPAVSLGPIVEQLSHGIFW